MNIFGVTDSASAFMLGGKSDRLRINKDDGELSQAPDSEPKAKESFDDEEKQDCDIINEYYRLSKKRRYALEELLPLAALDEGQRGKIVVAVGGRRLISRLCDIGLTPETPFRVLKKGLMEGPIILEVRSCELAIGREIASKVLVKPI